MDDEEEYGGNVIDIRAALNRIANRKGSKPENDDKEEERKKPCDKEDQSPDRPNPVEEVSVTMAAAFPSAQICPNRGRLMPSEKLEAGLYPVMNHD